MNNIAYIAAGGWDAGAYIQSMTLHGVPEPATISLFVLGLAGIGLMKQRKAS